MESRERSTADGLDYKRTKGTVLFLYGGRRCFLGEDILACIQGGDKPHIGCTVQSVPRPSLTGNGTISATSSVLNLTGHKDEALCRRLAEKLCRETGRVVVCTGGFHIDNMKPEQIDEVVKALDGLADEIVSGIAGAGYSPLSTGF